LLNISTTEVNMATVNFSVPDDVKKAFNRVFRNTSKSAVIADLMRRAVADADRKKRRLELFRLLTERRQSRESATDKEIRAARGPGRS
jgi:hypothetical protein